MNKKHKCSKCGKLCYGKLCRKCFSKKRRGQLSRIGSLKNKK